MKMAESSPKGKKTLLEKEKLLVRSNFSISYSVFKRLFLQTRKSQGLFGKGLREQCHNNVFFLYCSTGWTPLRQFTSSWKVTITMLDCLCVASFVRHQTQYVQTLSCRIDKLGNQIIFYGPYHFHCQRGQGPRLPFVHPLVCFFSPLCWSVYLSF